MPKGQPSGYTLKQADVAIVLGMQARGDRDHDIAAWFGVNQGRVAEAKDGKYGRVPPAPANTLPPKGPPGIKGRRLRASMENAMDALAKKGTTLADIAALLKDAASKFDKNEA